MASERVVRGFVFFLLSVFSFSAQASPDLDRRYGLESIGYLKPWDNVDGIFADAVEQAYKSWSARQSRFRVQDLGQAGDLIPKSKSSYSKLIEDPTILGQLAKTLRVESLIRARISKEKDRYKIQLDWLHAPAMNILSTVTTVWKEPEVREFNAAGWSSFQPSFHQALEDLVAKVPFKGTVTGRDREWVTINIGASAGIRVGDVVVLGTLEDARQHPLFKTVVDWSFATTGRVEITETEDLIAFGKIVDEEKNHEIAKLQKVLKILPGAEAFDPTGMGVDPRPNSPRNEEKRQLELERRREEAEKNAPPQLGFVNGGLWIGGVSREVTTDGTNGKSGGGFLIGARGEGQLWINQHFFAELSAGAGSYSYSQGPLGGSGSTSESWNGSLTRFQGNLGYQYAVSGNFFGPRGWVKAGYRSSTYSLPLQTAELTGSSTTSGLVVGIGADLPIREVWGVLLNFDIGLFKSTSESMLTSSVSGATLTGPSDVGVFLGGYYRVLPRLAVRVGGEFFTSGADISVGGVAVGSVSNRAFAFSPSVLYYF